MHRSKSTTKTVVAEHSHVRSGSRLCENAEIKLSRRTFVSNTLNKKRTSLVGTAERRKERTQFCSLFTSARFHTAWVESRCGAVALGGTYLLPPLSSGGALVVQPWLRFHIPLIEPDMQISRIRLSDKSSRFRVQRLLQFLNSFRS